MESEKSISPFIFKGRDAPDRFCPSPEQVNVGDFFFRDGKFFLRFRARHSTMRRGFGQVSENRASGILQGAFVM